MNGKVKFFNESKGFGFIAAEDDKEYFVLKSIFESAIFYFVLFNHIDVKAISVFVDTYYFYYWFVGNRICRRANGRGSAWHACDTKQREHASQG